MPLEELYGSRELTLTRNGASARRVFDGDWVDAIYNSPHPGDPYPNFAACTVDTVRITPTGQGLSTITGMEYTRARVEVEYTLDYRRVFRGDPPAVTWDMSSEALNTACGRAWDDGAHSDTIDIDDLSTAVVYPMMTLTIDVAVASLSTTELGTIFALQGCINNAAFQGAAAETLLFEGATATAQFDYSDSSWYYRVTYRFLKRQRSHNYIWRPPERVWDTDTNDWARNSDGTYQYTGVGGAWKKTTPVLYSTGDFTTLPGYS